MRTETFATPGPTALTVKVPAGTVELDARAGETTDVALEVLKGDEELEHEATIELRERGGIFEVVVEAPRKRLGFGREEYAVTIAVPEGAAVEVSSASAAVQARGHYGDFEAESASGNTNVEHVGGKLNVKSASGDVSARAVGGTASVHTASGDIAIGSLSGEGTIRSASGDVAVRESDADLSVVTASGDQAIGSASAGEVKLRSGSGDVHVGIRKGSRVRVDARSGSGEMESELELGDAEPTGDGPMVELSAVTGSGDVRIARA
jgi:Putative adhesin